MPSSIRKALNELPITLDDTYERMLQGIPKEKFEHANRLFQCMVAALRPLRVEELAELFAIEFGPNNVPNLVSGWRPEDPEEAVLSTCSTFITIIDDGDSKIVQFSHFSVKEFLTSDRLQTSNVGNIRRYYILLEPAHVILARACVTVLLRLDDERDDEGFRALPLASYTTQYWLRHLKFEDVASRIQDSLVILFDPKMPYFKPRILLQYARSTGVIKPTFFNTEPDKVTPLVLAAFYGLSGLAKHLIVTHPPGVNAKYYNRLSPLHAASLSGEVDCALILLDNGAHINAEGYENWTTLHYASYCNKLEFAQFLLKHGANVNARTEKNVTPLYIASKWGHLEIVQLLLKHGADVTIHGDGDLTPYQAATKYGHHDLAQLLLEHSAQRE
jgi:hypothetical protein